MVRDKKPNNELDTDFKVKHLDLPSKSTDHPDNLPIQAPCRLLVCGPSGSGKSFLIVSTLLNWYKKYFDNVYLVSVNAKQTAQANPFDLMNLDDDKVFEEYSEQVIYDIFRKAANDGRKGRTLLILDDCAGELQAGGNRGIMSRMIIMSRHFGVSVIITCQRIRMIPSTIRSNLTSLIAFKMSNKKEVDVLLEEFLNTKNGKEILNEAWADDDEGRPFLHANMEKNKMYKRYNYQLIDSDDTL